MILDSLFPEELEVGKDTCPMSEGTFRLPFSPPEPHTQPWWINEEVRCVCAYTVRVHVRIILCVLYCAGYVYVCALRLIFRCMHTTLYRMTHETEQCHLDLLLLTQAERREKASLHVMPQKLCSLVQYGISRLTPNSPPSKNDPLQNWRERRPLINGA